MGKESPVKETTPAFNPVAAVSGRRNEAAATFDCSDNEMREIDRFFKADHGVYFKKYLRHGPRGELVRLISINKDYPPLEFKLSDFRFIYPIVNMVRAYRRNA